MNSLLSGFFPTQVDVFACTQEEDGFFRYQKFGSYVCLQCKFCKFWHPCLRRRMRCKVGRNKFSSAAPVMRTSPLLLCPMHHPDFGFSVYLQKFCEVTFGFWHYLFSSVSGGGGGDHISVRQASCCLTSTGSIFIGGTAFQRSHVRKVPLWGGGSA